MRRRVAAVDRRGDRDQEDEEAADLDAESASGPTAAQGSAEPLRPIPRAPARATTPTTWSGPSRCRACPTTRRALSGRDARGGQARAVRAAGVHGAPVAGGLVVLELEGRFAPQNGRFSRQPMLVVESSDDRPRLELAPIRASATTAAGAASMRSRPRRCPVPASRSASAGRCSSCPPRRARRRRPAERARARGQQPAPCAGGRRGRAAATARAEADASAAELGPPSPPPATARSPNPLTASRRLEAELRPRALRSAPRTPRPAPPTPRPALGQPQRPREPRRRARRCSERSWPRSGSVTLDPDVPDAAGSTDADVTAVHRSAVRPGGPTGDPVAPTSTHTAQPRGPGPWVAVGALVLFAFVLAGLFAGFLG